MELNEKRMYVSISAGTLCLLIGLGQLLYALLALVSVVFVDILGLGLTVASVAVAAVPDKPIEVPYARTLATTIGLIGAAFGIVCFVVGPISFFQRRLPTIGFAGCILFCVVLSVIHFANSLTFGASVYIFVGLLFSLAIASDQAITRLSVASP